MWVLVINRAANYVQIFNGNGNYTCPCKTIDNELYFRFKNQWHLVSDYVTENTREFI